MEFACSLCLYTSQFKHNVKAHINKQLKCGDGIAEIIEIPIEIKCNLCNKTFTTKVNLNKHLKICKVNKSDELLVQNLSSNIFIPKIVNYMYLLHEREFINSNQNIYKIGFTKALHNRMGSYPKGSKIICVLPVSEDPESFCIQKFRSKFISKTEIGFEYFEGNPEEMVKLLIESLYLK